MRLQQGLFLIVTLFMGTQGTSPCPDTLRYLPGNDGDGSWTAEVSLSTEDELQGVWLHVVLDRKANTLLNWFGESSTIDNQEYSIRSPQYKLESGPSVLVKIRAMYNAAEPIPRVKRIRLNGRTICAADKVTRTTEAPDPFVSLNKPFNSDDGLIQLSSDDQRSKPHETTTPEPTTPRTTRTTSIRIRRPPTHRRITTTTTARTTTTTEAESGGSPEYFNGDYFSHVLNNQQPEKKRRPVGLENGGIRCGVPVKRATPLITHGRAAIEGAWPWHIAIYTSDGLQLKYICGGSLIGKIHILTAAHCVARPGSGRPADPEGFLIHLGRTNLRRFGRGIQERHVDKIHIHPEYNHTYFYNDIAVLTLSQTVEYTDYVRPVCLWNQEQEENIVNELGTVVGWGFDEHKKITENLQETKMPVIDLIKCIYSNRDVFNKFTSANNFCAGFMNGTSVCNGDSGGGMFFLRPDPYDDEADRWEIRGMVSVSQVLQNRYCDPYGYTVFTDVYKFVDWIQETLNKEPTSN